MSIKTVKCCDCKGSSDAASCSDLAGILQEVYQLRVQLERCISSNDRLRYTLRKSGLVSADDGLAVSAYEHDGKLLFVCMYVCMYVYCEVDGNIARRLLLSSRGNKQSSTYPGKSWNLRQEFSSHGR